MTNLEKNARTYRLPQLTTPEDLACAWSHTCDFGSRFLVAGYFYSYNEPCWFGAVYEHTTDRLDCEDEVRLIAVSDEKFEDNGHAFAWAMAQ